jgi:hypothetical protein
VTATPVADGRQTVAWRFRFNLMPPEITPQRQLVVKVNPTGAVQIASVPGRFRK